MGHMRTAPIDVGEADATQVGVDEIDKSPIGEGRTDTAWTAVSGGGPTGTLFGESSRRVARVIGDQWAHPFQGRRARPPGATTLKGMDQWEE